MRPFHPYIALILCLVPLRTAGAAEPSRLSAALVQLAASRDAIRGRVERGAALLRSGRAGQAVEELSAAVELLPLAEPVPASAWRAESGGDRAALALRGIAEAMALRGAAFSLMARDEEARRDLTEYVRLAEQVAYATNDPGYGLGRLDAYDELLRLCAGAGRYGEARTAWERLLRRFHGAREVRMLLPCQPVERMAWLALEAADAAGSAREREAWLLFGGEIGDYAEELTDPRRGGAMLVSSAAMALRGDTGRALSRAAAAAASLGGASGFLLASGTPKEFLDWIAGRKDAPAPWAGLASWMLSESLGDGDGAERARRAVRSTDAGLNGIDPSGLTSPVAGAFLARALLDRGDPDGAAGMLVAASLDSRLVLSGLLRRHPELGTLRSHPALRALEQRWNPQAADPWEGSTEPMRLVVQRGHALDPQSVDRSADGRFIATVDPSGIAILWNPQGIKLAERNIVGPSERFPEAIRIAPGGTGILTGSNDGITCFPLDGSPYVAFERHTTPPGDPGVREIRYTGDAALVVGFDRPADQAEDDFTIGIWHPSGRLVHRLVGHEDWISVLSCPADCPVMASGDDGGVVRLWDLVSGSCIARFGPPTGASGPVRRLEVRTTGESCLVEAAYRTGTGSFSCPLDPETARGPSPVGNAPTAEPFGTAAVNRGGEIPRPRHVEGTDVPAAEPDVERPAEVRVSPEVRSDRIADARISPSGTSILAAFQKGTIQCLSLDGKVEASAALPPGYAPVSLAFRPGTEELLVTAREEGGGGARLLRLLDGKLTVKQELVDASESSAEPADEGSFFPSANPQEAYFSDDGGAIGWDGRFYRVTERGISRLEARPGELSLVTAHLEEAIMREMAAMMDIPEAAVSYGGKTTLAMHEGRGRLFAAAEPPEKANAGRATPVLLLQSEDVADSLLVGELGGIVGGVRRLQFDPTGRYLLAYGLEPFLRLYNVETGAAINIVTRGTEWITYTDDGLFDASGGGGPLVAVVQGLTAYGIDQFAASRNRPDLMLDRMRLGTPEQAAHYRSQHERRLRRLGIGEAEAAAVTGLPQARIAGERREGREVALAIEFRSAGAELLSYQLYANGVPLFPGAGKPLSGKAASARELIELAGGENRIEVSVINRQGAESLRARTILSTAPAAARDLYYVGFGVSDYRDDSLDLGFAARDAEDLAASFRAMEGRAFGRVRTRLFTDRDVTPAAVAEAGSFFSEARVDDVVVVFVSGHGVHDRDDEATYYYITHDADLRQLAATAVRFEAIEATLASTPSRNRLLLIDTCESGELLPGDLERYLGASASAGLGSRGLRVVGAGTVEADGREAPRRYLLDRDRFIYTDVNRRAGAVVFSSCRGGELSYEDARLENGLFTEHLLRALRCGDIDHDGSVAVDEMRILVPRWVSEATGGLQNPTVDRDNRSARIAFPLLEPQP